LIVLIKIQFKKRKKASTPETTTTTTTTTMESKFELPSYLSALPQSDPWYAELLQDAYNPGYHIYNPTPGTGGLKEFMIVQFERDHDVYRLFGGSSVKCGYWWSLAPDDNCYATNPAISVEQYKEKYLICPEWNEGSSIIHATIPAGSVFIVGIGQSVHCGNGDWLEPKEPLLQLSGDACKIDTHDAQDTCLTNQMDFQESSCVFDCSYSEQDHHRLQQQKVPSTRQRALRGDLFLESEAYLANITDYHIDTSTATLDLGGGSSSASTFPGHHHASGFLVLSMLFVLRWLQ
jgi:hypothetical protein